MSANMHNHFACGTMTLTFQQVETSEQARGELPFVLFLKRWFQLVYEYKLCLGTCKDVNSVLVSPPHTSLQSANPPNHFVCRLLVSSYVWSGSN
jgi:hypothetical protein